MSPDPTCPEGAIGAPTGRRARAPIGAAAATLLLSLALTAVAWRSARAEADRRVRAEFEFRARDAERRIATRMVAYEQVLRAAAGLFAASREVGRDAFHRFAAALELDVNYPGIQGVGYAAVIPAAERDAHLARVRAEGFPGYAIWPPGDRETCTAIVFLEPFAGRNLRAFGFDMYSEPVRRAAMERARDEGTAALSGRVTLVQETDRNVQPGFLMYLPVYRRDAPHATPAERRSAILGWLYAPFRAGDLMQGVYGEPRSDIDIELFDGPEPQSAAVLFDGDGSVLESDPGRRGLDARRTLHVAGHSWTLTLTARREFWERNGSARPRLVAIAGAGASVLLAALVGLLVAVSAALRNSRALNRELAAAQRSLSDSIAERRRRELELRRLAAAVEQAPVSIVIADPAWRVEYVNPAFERTSGFALAEVVGKPVSAASCCAGSCAEPHACVEAQTETCREITTVVGSGGTWVGQVASRKKTGEVLTEDAVIAPVKDASGAVRNYVAVKRDVSTELELARQLAESRRLDTVARLAGGIAHDFNNLLTVILSCADAMREDLRAGGTASAEDVEEVRGAGERARDLTRKLLAFARSQTIQPVPMALDAAVRDSEKLLRRLLREDIAVRVTTQTGLWTARCDPSQFEQVLLNLAVNAGDAMPTGGSLTLETTNVVVDERGAERFAGVAPGRYVRFAVEDTGSGMTPEVRARAFEPFFTTKPVGKGTGLGLSTVHGIVKQNGGYIAFESEVGRGTRFEVLFPAVDAAPVSELEKVIPIRRGTETILVVEDDARVREVTRRALESAGYEVVTAAGGREALHQLQQHRGAIHLVVTDVVMPGMNGRAVAEAVREAWPAVRVLFVSGHVQDVLAERGVLADGVDLLEKPYTPAALLARVRRALDRREQTATA